MRKGKKNYGIPGMKAAKFYVFVDNPGNDYVELKSGYSDGKFYFYDSLYRDQKNRSWCAILPETGREIARGKTLEQAKENAGSDLHAAELQELYGTEKYIQECAAFDSCVTERIISENFGSRIT